MKSTDISFGTKLSLMHRHLEAAQLNLDTANEFMRETVADFDRMQKILAAEEFRSQQYQNGHANGVTRALPALPAPGPLDEESESTAPVKAKREYKTPEARERMAQGAAHARAVRLAKLKGEPIPPKPDFSAAAKPGTGKLKRIDAKNRSEFGGMFPYPYFVLDFITEYGMKEFDKDEIVKHGATLGYLLERNKVGSALAHLANEGALKIHGDVWHRTYTVGKKPINGGRKDK